LYDFRNPDKFSREHIRMLLLLHEHFARLAASSLSARLRTAVQVEPETAAQMSFGEFLAGVGDPTVLGIFRLEPLPGSGLLELQPELAFLMLDRLLGGPGLGRGEARPATEVELHVLQRVIQFLLDTLAEAWRGVLRVSAGVLSVETSPVFAQLAPPNEAVASLQFTLHLSAQRGHLRLCLPYSLLKPILPLLVARQWASGEEATSQERRGIPMEQLADVPVWIVAELGQAELAVGELLSLAVGDVIRLDRRVEDGVRLRVDGTVKFVAKPGLVGNRVGVKVVAVLKEVGDVG
ncbi:MAG: flagellar motor switch protein FliM, partial [Clostridia bacterium]|nr:flagellar motor switch protein FliM [Clostridia bacterium]